MLVTAPSYTAVRAASRGVMPARTFATPAIRVARSNRLDPRVWVERELREGGYFSRYVQREKGQLPAQIRRVAQRYHKAKRPWSQLPKAAKEGEWELQYALPARLYFRWLAQDPDFFNDPANLKALRRDNPELCIFR